MGKRMLFTRVARNTKLLEKTLIRNVKVQEQYGDIAFMSYLCTEKILKKIITGGMIRLFKLYIPINMESE